MANETQQTEQPPKTGTSADVVMDDTGKKLREAQDKNAKLELTLAALTAEKAKQESIIETLSRMPGQLPSSKEKKKSLLDELCEFLGID